ncbi:DVUA0089 family protein [Paracoccus siganidrum]|uniref:ABC transporter substrate-binding protein n=1 Tax=Paracoccus siganidrum TaxID=1276757 RepID=A0A419AAN8_9RHOB|nr:DVUA0089 family protein [Paracoccus siganidrum]RJL20129.1 hypothetical protein D3P05_03960 [Paracoccus siganidrum]RMC32556.1 hypothetical protein C9E82_14655 [Paracoccus siganidrum]
MIFRNTSRLACIAIAASSGFSAPVLAQDAPAEDTAPLCEGMAAAWIGDGPEGSDISAADAPLSANLSATARAQGLIAFRVTAESQPLRIEAQSSGDPAITLLTMDGDEIADNDDTPESLNSRIEESVGPGDYCVALRSVGGERIEATLQVGRPDQPALLNESGGGEIAACSPDTEATALAEGALEAGFASGPVSATQDGNATGYYRFTIAEATPVTLRATSAQLDPHVRLFDSNGGLIAENDDADGTDSRLDFPSNLMPGDYCLGVAALSPGVGQISVSAQMLDRDAFLQAAWRRGEIAPPADGAYPVQQIDLASIGQTVVLQDGSAQWFRFQIEAPTVLIVDAYGSLAGVDPKLALFATSGALAGQNDDHGGTTDAKLGPLLLEPGSYNLVLTDVNRIDQPGAPMRPVGLVFDIFERVARPE